MKAQATYKLTQAIEKLQEAQQLIREAYFGDSADESIQTIGYVVEDLQTDIELFSE